MSVEFVNSETFEIAAIGIMRRSNVYGNVSNIRRFKACFGTSPSVCSKLWSLITDELPFNRKPIHLLWGLNFLKTYTTEAVRSLIFHADEKTLRKWQWAVVKCIASANLVCIY